MAIKKKSIPAKRSVAKKQAVKKAAKKAQTAKPGFIDHFVSIKIANEMIGKGQAAGLLPPMQFSADCIREILAQKKVAYLRIYAVINEAGNQTYLLTGGSANHRRIDVVRKKSKKIKGLTGDGTGDMNIAQVCDPVKQSYTQAP
jgi:hypothetical protein